VSWSGNPACSIKEVARDSCSSTRLGTHRYSGDNSQSGCGTQANTYSDRTRSQGASSDPGEGSLERRLSDWLRHAPESGRRVRDRRCRRRSGASANVCSRASRRDPGDAPPWRVSRPSRRSSNFSAGEFWLSQRELSQHLKYIVHARIPKFEFLSAQACSRSLRCVETWLENYFLDKWRFIENRPARAGFSPRERKGPDRHPASLRQPEAAPHVPTDHLSIGCPMLCRATMI
jgi:hypothetical protein